MPHYTTRQLARIAARAGHEDLTVTGGPGAFRISCSCGYSSTRRQTEALAAQAGIHHLNVIVRDIVGMVTMSGRTMEYAIESSRVKTLQATPSSKVDAGDTPLSSRAS